MDKAVVIGGAGFVGSHVADELSRRGYRVTVFDHVPSPWVTESQEMLVGDMRDQAALTKAISNARFLYHFGGVSDIDEAIAMANDTDYGLSAGIFTQNMDIAMRFIKEVHSGNVHINSGPGWRADIMPYGGVKYSGLGKEGPRYAIEEMTELKMVVIHS